MRRHHYQTPGLPEDKERKERKKGMTTFSLPGNLPNA